MFITFNNCWEIFAKVWKEMKNKNGIMFLSYTGKRVEKQWPIHNVSGTSDILEVEFLHIYIFYTKIT